MSFTKSWASKIPIKGESKEVLESVAEQADEYGRFPVSLKTIASSTDLPELAIVKHLKYLINIKAIVFLGVNDGFNLNQLLDDSGELYHCKLSQNIPPYYFEQWVLEAEEWQE